MTALLAWLTVIVPAIVATVQDPKLTFLGRCQHATESFKTKK